jgi:hypothetical protein
MARSLFRIIFALAVSLSLALGVFAGVGIIPASAASGPNTGGGYNPAASTPPGISYCYPTGYNRNGWRCGWRLAQAPYNLGDYNRYYYGYYYNNYPYYGYGPYYNSGTGGYPTPSNPVDYGGSPRYGYYYYNGYYYPCSYSYGQYCYGY